MKWQFPHCIGALDGKHIEIQPPYGSGTNFYNYKGTRSVVLTAIADADYQFIYIAVDTKPQVSDGAVWNDCSFNKCLELNNAGLPGRATLKNSTKRLPYVFVADNAFPLKEYLLKPFPSRSQTDEQRIFSYRLSRARRTIENALGIMGSRFRVLNTRIALSPQKVETVVLACAALHNFLQKLDPNEYQQLGSMDEENFNSGTIERGSWRNDTRMVPLQRSMTKNPNIHSKRLRDQFCHYFNNEGQVPWQWRMVESEQRTIVT